MHRISPQLSPTLGTHGGPQVPDVHAGRPMAPAYAERGAALMAQWAAEDRAAALDELLSEAS